MRKPQKSFLCLAHASSNVVVCYLRQVAMAMTQKCGLTITAVEAIVLRAQHLVDCAMEYLSVYKLRETTCEKVLNI